VVVPWGFELLLVGACVVTALVAAFLPAHRGTRWDEQALRRLAAE
jgi:hypothetical protein